jgi:6-phosphogluconolactonase
MSESRTVFSMPVSNSADWAQACADRLANALRTGLAENGRAVFAGSGGSTPSPIYARLAQADLDWSRITVTLVDERYVPETHPESNAALIKNTLMTGPAAAATFLPLYTSQVTVDRAAALAAHGLARAGDRLDAVLLGMGEDGHICSMFPHSPTLKTLLSPDLKPTVLGVPQGRDGLAPSRERLSINLPWLMTARCVVLALVGKTKLEVFEARSSYSPGFGLVSDDEVRAETEPVLALLANDVPLEVLWTEAA